METIEHLDIDALDVAAEVRRVASRRVASRRAAPTRRAQIARATSPVAPMADEEDGDAIPMELIEAPPTPAAPMADADAPEANAADAPGAAAADADAPEAAAVERAPRVLRRYDALADAAVSAIGAVQRAEWLDNVFVARTEPGEAGIARPRFCRLAKRREEQTVHTRRVEEVCSVSASAPLLSETDPAVSYATPGVVIPAPDTPAPGLCHFTIRFDGRDWRDDSGTRWRPWAGLAVQNAVPAFPAVTMWDPREGTTEPAFRDVAARCDVARAVDAMIASDFADERAARLGFDVVERLRLCAEYEARLPEGRRGIARAAVERAWIEGGVFGLHHLALDAAKAAVAAIEEAIAASGAKAEPPVPPAAEVAIFVRATGTVQDDSHRGGPRSDMLFTRYRNRVFGRLIAEGKDPNALTADEIEALVREDPGYKRALKGRAGRARRSATEAEPAPVAKRPRTACGA